jgi:hypothetical protein
VKRNQRVLLHAQLQNVTSSGSLNWLKWKISLIHFTIHLIRDSSVSTVTWHSAGRPMNRGSTPISAKRFICIPNASGSATGNTQPLVSLLRGLFPSSVKRPRREATHHLVPRLRMSGAVPPLPHCLHGMYSGDLYLYLYRYVPKRFATQLIFHSHRYLHTFPDRNNSWGIR